MFGACMIRKLFEFEVKNPTSECEPSIRVLILYLCLTIAIAYTIHTEKLANVIFR